jgi:hypothetical protein
MVALLLGDGVCRMQERMETGAPAGRPCISAKAEIAPLTRITIMRATL